MKRYFKIHFYNNATELYVTASSMNKVRVWVLKNRPMNDYYLMNIIEVNADKTRKQHGDFMCIASREYYHYPEVYGNMSDEEIRKEELKRSITGVEVA